MGDVSISQNELDNLFGTLEEIPEEKHIWIVKDMSIGGGVIGFRNYSLFNAQNTLAKAQKDHPGRNLQILQLR